LISAQQAVNKLNQEGVTSGADYERALLSLKSAQDGVAISTDRVSQAQGDVTQVQLGFALNVVPSVLSSISAITTVTEALRSAKILNVGATAAEGVANISTTATTGVLTTATIAQTEATEGATLASRLLEVAMGPVGWVIIGVGAATAALATNFLGFRDAVNAAGKAIGYAMPFLRPLLDGLSSVANAFGLSGDNAKKGQEDISSSLTSIQGSTSTASTNMINDMSSANTSIEQNLGNISDNFNKSASQVESAAERMRNAITSLGGNVALPGQSVDVQKGALQQNILSDKQIMDLNQAIQNYTDFKNQVFTPGVTQVGGSQADTLGALLDRKQEAERMLALDHASRSQYRSLLATDQQQQQQVQVDVTLTADADLKAKITGGSFASSMMTRQ
jgi:hypothetical protein